MKTRLNTSIITAGTALILLTGCVSSKKYKASQAELARARNDSAQLAQQVTALNSSVKDLQDKNAAAQRSLDQANNNYTTQQKSLEYYQGYFKEQENAMTQVDNDVKNALTQAGINNGDVEQTNNVVYVKLDENDLFKKNSTTMTSSGRQALDNMAQVFKNRSNCNVFVGAGDSAVAGSTADMGMDNGMSSGNVNASGHSTVRHHRTTHPMTHSPGSSSGATAGSSQSSAQTSAASTQSSGNSTAQTHKKVHHHYSSEGSMAVYKGPGHMHTSHAWALKQGRMVAVADHFLQNGVPKINVTLQHPPMTGTPDNTIKVVIMPKMEDFNPQSGASATR